MKTFAKLSVLVVLAVSSAAIAHAGTISYDFSYSGTGVNASGVLTTSSTADPNYAGANEYDITSLTGTRNNLPMSLGCASCGYGYGTNLFNPTSFFPWNTRQDYGIAYSLEISTPGGGYYSLETPNQGGSLGEMNTNNDNFIPITFTAAVTPEPPSLLLLGTGLLGMAFLLFRRKAVRPVSHAVLSA
ncbi:MAG: PEP-CTERM sorting domain-containing protein [Acidobacteriaceae bacterium]